MSAADFIVFIRIVLYASIAFGFPHLLKAIHFKVKDNSKKIIVLAALILYLLFVLLFAFFLRTEINGTGIITDPLWAYRQLFKSMASGYEVGGIIEAIRRISWVRDTVASLILNILFFVPFGYLVPCNFKWTRTWWRVLLLALLLSISVEILQYVLHRGWFDVADPIYNSGGALIGYILYGRLLQDTALEERA